MEKSSYKCETYKLLQMMLDAFLTSSHTTNMTTIKNAVWLQNKITGNWFYKEATLKYVPYHEKVILNSGYTPKDQNIV